MDRIYIDQGTIGQEFSKVSKIKFLLQDLGATHIMAVREALHGKSLSPKGDFDNHDKHGVCQVSVQHVDLSQSPFSHLL